MNVNRSKGEAITESEALLFHRRLRRCEASVLVQLGMSV